MTTPPRQPAPSANRRRPRADRIRPQFIPRTVADQPPRMQDLYGDENSQLIDDFPQIGMTTPPRQPAPSANRRRPRQNNESNQDNRPSQRRRQDGNGRHSLYTGGMQEEDGYETPEEEEKEENELLRDYRRLIPEEYEAYYRRLSEETGLPRDVVNLIVLESQELRRDYDRAILRQREQQLAEQLRQQREEQLRRMRRRPRENAARDVNLRQAQRRRGLFGYDEIEDLTDELGRVNIDDDDTDEDMQGNGRPDYALHAVVVKKPVELARAKDIAKNFITEDKHFYRQTKASYRFRNIPKEQFVAKSFRSKKVNPQITLVYGKLSDPTKYKGAGFFGDLWDKAKKKYGEIKERIRVNPYALGLANYCGPGTSLEGQAPLSKSDSICKTHDERYNEISKMAKENKASKEELAKLTRDADNDMLRSLAETKESSLGDKIVHTASTLGIKAKTILEDLGIIDPLKFSAAGKKRILKKLDKGLVGGALLDIVKTLPQSTGTIDRLVDAYQKSSPEFKSAVSDTLKGIFDRPRQFPIKLGLFGI